MTKIEQFRSLLDQLKLRCNSGDNLKQSIVAVSAIAQQLVELQRSIWGSFDNVGKRIVQKGAAKICASMQILRIEIDSQKFEAERQTIRILVTVGTDPFQIDAIDHGATTLFGSTITMLQLDRADSKWASVAGEITGLCDKWSLYPPPAASGADYSESGEAKSATTCPVASVIGQINPGGTKSLILQAMEKGGATSTENRLTQQEILKKALGNSASANDYKRDFLKLQSLSLVEKGSNGRGFFITSLGIQAAAKLRAYPITEPY